MKVTVRQPYPVQVRGRNTPTEWIVTVRRGDLVDRHRFHDLERAEALVSRLLQEGAELVPPPVRPAR